MTYIIEDDLNDDVTETGARNHTLLAFKRLNWRATCKTAPQLMVIDEASKCPHPCTLVEALDSTSLSSVVDASQVAWPLWFVKLPHALWPHAPELAMRFPDAINLESDDLLHKYTYYCSLVVPQGEGKDRARSECSVMDEAVGYVFFSGFVRPSITAACELGGLNLILRTGATSIFASYALNEDEFLDLQVAGDSCGPNWRTHRIYDEGQVAAVASRGAGGDAYVLGTLPKGQYSCAVSPFEHSEPYDVWAGVLRGSGG